MWWFRWRTEMLIQVPRLEWCIGTPGKEWLTGLELAESLFFQGDVCLSGITFQ